MKKLTTILLLFLSISGYSQTANNSIPLNTTKWSYGVNPGYYSNSLTDQNVYYIGSQVGAHLSRPFLTDSFVTQYGYNVRNAAIQYAADSVGMGLILNLGEQYAADIPVSHLYDTTFIGCTQQARMWKNMWLPDTLSNGSINTSNYFANYIWNVLQQVGGYIQFVEVCNEPDITSATYNGYQFGDAPKSYDSSWWNVPPYPSYLTNEQAPVFWYNRLLHIAYDVTKKYNHNLYVGIGGVGFPSFYDCLFRYTDNPVDGSVTSSYPLKGSAYFDVDLFHKYPWYYASIYNDSCSCRLSAYNSDSLAKVDIMFVNEYDSIGKSHGYNGTTYPRKYIACTEEGVGSSYQGSDFGNDSTAAWYSMKAQALFQQWGVIQDTKYQTGSTYPTGGNIYATMGYIDSMNNPSESITNFKINDIGYGIKTMSTLMYGYSYDSATTATLHNTDTTTALAFTNGSGTHVYMIWASKHLNPNSETASATYTLPAGTFTEYQWNWSRTNTTTTVSGAVVRNSAPAFFLSSQQPTPPIVVVGKRLTAKWVNGQVVIGWDSTGTISSLKVCYGTACTNIAPTNLYTPTQLGTLIINAIGYTSDTLNVPSIYMSQWYNQVQVNINEGASGSWGLWNTAGVQKQKGTYSKGVSTIKMTVTNYPHGVYSFVTADLVIKITL